MAIPAYTFSEQFMDKVRQLEEYFDSKLLSSEVSDTNKFVAIVVPIFYESKYLVALKERYVKAGWKNVNEDMERDGSWLIFQFP